MARPPQFQQFRRMPPADAVKVGAHDPRGAPLAFDTSRQPDELQFERLRRRFADHFMPLEEVVALLDSKNVPPQLRHTPFVQVLAEVTNANPPKLLIPANPARMGYMIVNPSTSADLWFSYGAPIYQAGVWLGTPIGKEDHFEESNGTVAIDDLYVWTTNSIGNVCLGYEGVLAIESYNNQQLKNL
jgi:hypothetical protein